MYHIIGFQVSTASGQHLNLIMILGRYRFGIELAFYWEEEVAAAKACIMIFM